MVLPLSSKAMIFLLDLKQFRVEKTQNRMGFKLIQDTLNIQEISGELKAYFDICLK